MQRKPTTAMIPIISKFHEILVELEDGVGLDEGVPIAYEVGLALGAIKVRDETGEAVGEPVGEEVGEAVVGLLLGDELGDVLGIMLGTELGATVG